MPQAPCPTCGALQRLNAQHSGFTTQSSGLILATSQRVQLRCVIFDIDGTLVDSNDAHARSWVEAFAKFGKEIDYDVVRHQVGKGGDLLVPDLLNAKEMRRFGDDVKQYKGDLYKEKFLPRVKPFPRVKAIFEALRARGAKLALASSSHQDEVEYYVRLLGVEQFLEGSTSKKDAKLSKPSPEIFEAALEQAGCDPEFTCVVGDTPYDILAAHRTALPIVAVSSGGFEAHLLAKAEFQVEGVWELEGKIDDIDAWFND